MATFDVNDLLEPISDEAPCGDDLEYDSEFGELVRVAKGKPEHMEGDKEIPAEPPKWNEVADLAVALLGRTRDLRVAAHLAQAELHLNGFPGFAESLALIHGLSTSYWDDVHPRLVDEDGDEDPDYRANSLAPLNSKDGVVGSVSRAVLASSRALGQFSLRDMRLANGEISPGPDEETPDPTHIDAAFMDCDLDELQATAAAADRCRDLISAIDTYYREQLGIEITPEFSALEAEMKEVRRVLTEQLGNRGVETEGDEEDAGAEGGSAPAQAMRLGEINSREDAIKVIDKLCEYFRKNEPSSPVPLLLQRAKRLIAKDFLEILKDLTPDGVSQAEMIGGVDNDS